MTDINGKLLIVFIPKKKFGFFDSGTSILKAAQYLGVSINTKCEQGRCGTCKVRVISNPSDHDIDCAKQNGTVSVQTEFLPYQLSCQEKVVSDLIVEIPE